MASLKTFLLLLLVLAFLSVAADAEPLVEVGNESFGVTVQSLEATPGGIRAQLRIENLTRSGEVFLHLEANATDAQDYFFLPGTRHLVDTIVLPIAPGGSRLTNVFFKLAPHARPGVLAVGDVHPPFDQIAVSLAPVLERQAQAMIAAAPTSRPSRNTPHAGRSQRVPALEASKVLRPASGSTSVQVARKLHPERAPSRVMVATAPVATAPVAEHPVPGPAIRTRTAEATSGHRIVASRPGSRRPLAGPHSPSLKATSHPAVTLLLASGPRKSVHKPATVAPRRELAADRLSRHGKGQPGSGPRVRPRVQPKVQPQVIFLPPNGHDRVIAVYAPPTRNFGQALILWAGHQGADGYGWDRIHADHPDVQESQIGYAATYPHQIWTDGRTYLFVRWDVRNGVAMVLQVAGNSIVSAQWATYDDLVYWLGPGRLYPRLIYQGGR